MSKKSGPFPLRVANDFRIRLDASRPARRREYWLFALTLPLAALAGPAFGQGDEQAFGYCAPPIPPSCVKKAVRGQPNEGCEEKFNAYVASVFAYRECLARESDRAVRQSNDVIDQWRCIQNGERCRP